MIINRRAMLALFAAVCVTLSAISVSAKGLPAADETAIQSIIEGQLAAFRADDAATAFSYASDTIKMKFGDADNFLHMVKTLYYPVYRPASYQFMDLSAEPGGVFQPVMIAKNTGDTVVALYLMEKDETGRWRIAGVRLVNPPGAGT